MMDKECIVCGYTHYVEKHHPDGKEHICTFVRRSGEDADVNMFNMPSEEVSGAFLQKKKEEGYSMYKSSKHIKPDEWIYLCGNCHNLVHKKGLSIDEIRELLEFEQDIQLELLSYMEMYVGNKRMDELKTNIIQRRERKRYLETLIGSVCQFCGKKHRSTWGFNSCIIKNESEELFMENINEQFKITIAHQGE